MTLVYGVANGNQVTQNTLIGNMIGKGRVQMAKQQLRLHLMVELVLIVTLVLTTVLFKR